MTERLIGELRGLGEILWRTLKRPHRWIGRHRLLVIMVFLNLFMLSWTAAFSYQTRPYDVYTAVEDETVIITDSYGYVFDFSDIISPLSLYPSIDTDWSAFTFTADQPLDADVYARSDDKLLARFVNVTEIPLLNYTQGVKLTLRTNKTAPFKVSVWFWWRHSIVSYLWQPEFPLERVIYHLLTYGIFLITVTDILLLKLMTAIVKEGTEHED